MACCHRWTQAKKCRPPHNKIRLLEDLHFEVLMTCKEARYICSICFVYKSQLNAKKCIVKMNNVSRQELSFHFLSHQTNTCFKSFLLLACLPIFAEMSIQIDRKQSKQTFGDFLGHLCLHYENSPLYKLLYVSTIPMDFDWQLLSKLNDQILW